MNEHKHDIDENLLLKFLLGQTSDGENRTVTDWLGQDSAHRYIVEKLESLWLETGKLVPAPVAVDIEMAWLKLTDRIDFGATDQPDESETGSHGFSRSSPEGMTGEPDVTFKQEKNREDLNIIEIDGLTKDTRPAKDTEENKIDLPEEEAGTGKLPRQGPEIREAVPGKVQGRQLRIYTLRIAATLLVLIGIYIVIFLLTRPAGEASIAAVTDNVTDTIPDGTIITLHKGSSLTYSRTFNEKERRIRLSGEAFFEVTRDAQRPFVVEAGGAGVKVLGTSFLVSVKSAGKAERRQWKMENGKQADRFDEERTKSGQRADGKNGEWNMENETRLTNSFPVIRHPLPVTRQAASVAQFASLVTNFTLPVTRNLSHVTKENNATSSENPTLDGTSDWMETIVLVETGRVMLFRVDERRGDTLSLFLEAGMRGRLAKGMKAPEFSDTAQPDEMFWKDRSLNFRQTPLREVIALVGKHYGIPITVARNEVLDCRLTASFHGESAEQIVSVIAASFNLEVRSTPSGYLLDGAGCTGEGVAK